MEQVLSQVDETSTTYIIAMTYLIFLTSVLGEFETAKKYTRQAREVISGYPEFERQVATALINTSCTYQYYISGDFHRSHLLNTKLLEMTLDLKLEPVLPLVYYQCSATSAVLGQYEQGYASAEKGIAVCQKIALQDSKKGWILIAFAQNCLGLGRLEQAIELLDLAIEIFEPPGNRWGLANAWHCLHKVCLEQKKPAPAKQLLLKAIDIIDSYGLSITEGILENSMANLLILENNFSAALIHLNRSRFKIRQAAFYLFENHMLSARAYLGLSRQKMAIHHFIKGLAISEKKDFHRFVKKETEWMSPLLQNRSLTQPLKKYIHKVLESLPDKRPPVLMLRLFGRFTAFIGEKEILSTQWKSSKALMILKYLASNRQKGFIPRDVLIELLWPDEDFGKTAKRFNVAMSALRKGLEPDLAPKAPSAYILRKKDAYRLSPGKTVKIDVELFLEAFSAAQKRKHTLSEPSAHHCLAAEAFYRGPFLEEDPYEDWCLLERDHLNSIYSQVLSSILQFHEAQKDIQNCVVYAKKLLKTDPYNEDILRKLLVFHAELGHTVNVKKTYAMYKKRAEEIDCPVNHNIRKLYKNLIQDQN